MRTLDDAREAARRRWGRITPYRLGYCAGLLGVSCPNPYAGTPRGERLYREGLMEGAGRRMRDAARQQQEGGGNGD